MLITADRCAVSCKSWEQKLNSCKKIEKLSHHWGMVGQSDSMQELAERLRLARWISVYIRDQIGDRMTVQKKLASATFHTNWFVVSPPPLLIKKHFHTIKKGRLCRATPKSKGCGLSLLLEHHSPWYHTQTAICWRTFSPQLTLGSAHQKCAWSYRTPGSR